MHDIPAYDYIPNTILAIVDMQTGFTRGSLANPAAEAIIPAIVKRIDLFRGPVIVVTRDTHKTDYLDTLEGKYLPIIHCVDGTEDHKIVPEIVEALKRAEARGIKIVYIDKPTFGYLGWATVLSQAVDMSTIKKITWVGTCTGICVLSNIAISKAAFPEIIQEVVEDECACVTPESHKTAIEAMKMIQVNII